ncbi:ferredoxin [Streptomyces sp. NPDC052309]|uniref:Ferredoxin n=1 Tax=Streptomyces griseicoloratus TaxID=2752516 RepID=A0A926QT35_9ACTN|nr:ferredoxin [Streptomyces griseicoloratus]MBD0423654.1 ferredoxin [Streptomyces griseicoloratus]
MHIGLDLGKCQGYGNCVAADEAHFDLDDSGLVVLLDDKVSEADRERVAAAVRSCPADALWLVENDG